MMNAARDGMLTAGLATLGYGLWQGCCAFPPLGWIVAGSAIVAAAAAWRFAELQGKDKHK
jgi:hypothetical protein